MGSHDGGIEKFPNFAIDGTTADAGGASEHVNGFSNAPPNGFLAAFPSHNGNAGAVSWDYGASRTGRAAHPYSHHHKQKSLGEAIRTIRTRSGSTTQNVHEIADALKAPISPTLIVLCVLWYSSSALTNTSSKSILNAFEKPATLTLVQFAFVSLYCMLLAWLSSVFPSLRRTMPALRFGIRAPSRDVIRTTLPLALFQIAGHLLSSNATSKIPVSLVHTVKGLSPLFTVFAYRLLFDIRYPTATYLSLVPLTLGVMLACSGSHSFSGGQQTLGVVYALLATFIFVSQNIFSKRLFNEASRTEAEGGMATARKLDKLNLLCYSSGMAFLLTGPIWLWGEGIGILGDFLWDGSVDLAKGPDSFDHGRLLVEFVFNGFVHFAQNILAFVLLSMVSPVTYSVASLIKRVFVIALAIVWFRSPTTKVQAVGIVLTFLGLYSYDRTNQNKADRRARTMTDTRGGTSSPLLPLAAIVPNGGPTSAAGLSRLQDYGLGLQNAGFENRHASAPVASLGADLDSYKKSDDIGRAPGRRGSASWMPPGTRQEDTWRVGDSTVKAQVV